MPIDRQDFYWLIGILEGEGTFVAASPSGRGVPVVRVAMTDRDIVERVGALIERAVIELPAREPHHKVPYVTCIKGTPAVALMRAVYSQMGALRQARIDRAVASWHGGRARWRRAASRCAVNACPRPGARRGLCVRHYDRWWKAQRRGRPTDFAPLDAPAPAFGPTTDPSEWDEACSIAWLAGLLEGEGAFTISRYSAEIAYPHLSLKMCDQGIVERAARLMRAPSVYRNEPEQEGWSPTYAFAMTGHAAAEWMRRLRPYMGHRRTTAIDAALAAYRPIRLVDPPAACVVPGCDGPHESRGLCHKHYMMWSRDRRNGREVRITPLR